MLRRLAQLFRKADYRVNTYGHADLSTHTQPAWTHRLKLWLWSRHGRDHAEEQPPVWVRHRKVILLTLGILLAWFLAESAAAWDFYEG